MQREKPVQGLPHFLGTVPALSAIVAHHKCQEVSLPYLSGGSDPALPPSCSVHWLEGGQYDLMVPSGRKGCAAYGLRFKDGATAATWLIALIVDHREGSAGPAVRTLRVQRPEFDVGARGEEYVSRTIPASDFVPHLEPVGAPDACSL